jgi:formylglycine-generating enzyme required for sulfatase activity
MKRMFLGMGLVLAAVASSILLGCPQTPPHNPQYTYTTYAGMTFAYCPAGTYMMGGTPGDPDSANGESPQHKVTLAKGFWMSIYPITQEEWLAVMGSNPSRFQGELYGDTDNNPVEGVSWDDVQVFLDNLNSMTPGMNFRLPSEAEWEYACRAGTTTRYYWGEDPDEKDITAHAWYEDNSNNRTAEAGKKEPNAWGLFDMSGNVWEWVQDGYGDYNYTPTDGTAYEYPDVASRIMRGGSYATDAASCRSASRAAWAHDDHGDNLGFRIVRF